MLEQLVSKFPAILTRLYFRVTRNEGGHNYTVGQLYAVNTYISAGHTRFDLTGKHLVTDQTGNHIMYPRECDLIIPTPVLPDLIKLVQYEHTETGRLIVQLQERYTEYQRENIQLIDPKAEEIQALYDDLAKQDLSKAQIVARIIKITAQ